MPLQKREIPLPVSDQQFRLDYEGYWSLGPWCTVDVYRREDCTIVIATDEADEHKGTSLTNRVERVMLLAWEKLGRVWPCYFVEHYRRNPQEFDLVTFQEGADGRYAIGSAGYFQGRPLKSFINPQWSRLKPGATPVARLLLTEEA